MPGPTAESNLGPDAWPALGRRAFGRSPHVSAFTLGTMRALDSPAQMEAVLRAALAAGINHIETAPAYGPAESFLGQAQKRFRQIGRAHV